MTKKSKTLMTQVRKLAERIDNLETTLDKKPLNKNK